MTADELTVIRRRIGMSVPKCCDLLGFETRTWRRWEGGHTAVPRCIARMMRLLQMHPAALSSLEVMGEEEED